MASAIQLGEFRRHLVHVLVATPAQGEDVEAVSPAVLKQPGDCMAGLERGDDPLEPCELPEGAQRLVIGGLLVGRAALIAQVGVLGADARVVEAGGDGVGFEDLPLRIGEH